MIGAGANSPADFRQTFGPDAGMQMRFPLLLTTSLFQRGQRLI
jgi:hypothetical protein